MILKNFQVLAYNDSNSVFISKHNSIYLFILGEKRMEKIYSFPNSKKIYLSKVSTYFRRLLRTDIRFAIKLDSDHLLVVLNQKFYKLSIGQKKIISIVDLPRGSRPLNMSILNGLNGFDNGIYFGEYFPNPTKKIVHIYKYEDDFLKKVFSFPLNSIDHVHNMIVDKQKKCLWILAGDFGDGAAIYKATDNFKSVERIVYGEQKYRSCVGFPVKDGLLYATDSQFEKNTIRVLKKENEVWKSESVSPINGPCIFGTQLKNDYVFSTSVEAINSGNTLQKFLRNKRGPGIIKNQTELIKGNLNTGFETLFSNRKDILPFVLFQFGNILFPTGENKTEKLIFTNIATKENDFSTQIINL